MLMYTKKIIAESVPQITSLGIDNHKYFKFVKNFKLGNQILSFDQYKVEMINSLTTDTLGTKTTKTRVILKSDTSKMVDLNVPVEVGWGNSVVYGSYNYVSDGRTSFINL